jgi:VIT1/CCC1 family predicted Fe2+/Mn2+ transporter
MLRENSSQSPDDHEVRLEEGNNLGENQNPRPRQAVVQKKLFYEMAELLSSSALGAGIGYLLGGLIKTFVDLSKIGIAEMQKQSTEENAKKYIGINEYTIAGISLGSMVGVVTYIFVSDLIKQRNEREMELQAVRDNVAENDNFNGALSDRQEVRITNHQGGRAEITNGIANGDNQMRLVGADITVNGDARHDLSRNPRHIMAVGEGNMNNTNVGSIFQLARSREASVDPANSLNELSVAGFEKLLREARESSKKFYDRELSADEESNLEVAKNFLKSGVYNNISKESPNLVFVLRDQEYQKQIEEKAKQEDEGAGVFSAGRRGQSPCPSIEQDLGIPVPNPELEIQSAFASALESLKSPRGDVRSSQAVEMHCDINQLMQSQQVFRAIKALEKKLPQDKSGAR